MEKFIVKKNFILPEVLASETPVELVLTETQKESLIADGTLVVFEENANQNTQSESKADGGLVAFQDMDEATLREKAAQMQVEIPADSTREQIVELLASTVKGV